MLPKPDILNEFEHGKFVLSNLAAKRARQIQEGAVPLVNIKSPHALSIALEEIAQGKVKATLPDISTLPGADLDQAHGEIERDAEFNVLLPSLDEIDGSHFDDDEEEHDLDADSDDDESSISDLVSGDEVDTVESESDSISLSDLEDEESEDDKESKE